MMRCIGSDVPLESPGNGDKIDLGVVGMKLYSMLDQLCREHTLKVIKRLGIPEKQLSYILDPVYNKESEVHRSQNDSSICYSDYVPPGFVSSSIMDNFHYFNSAFHKVDEQKDPNVPERFYNNHASHTDSGLMTVVVVTDIPGLEVLDQQTEKWIALEQLVHEYVYKDKTTPFGAHRKYATIFWADSCMYLNEKLYTKGTEIKSTFHRVEKHDKERYSVVFKQRTTPMTTPPRYQEDYEILTKQISAMEKLKKQGSNGWTSWLLPALSIVGIACAVAWITKHGSS
eukprot:TRINITY_DN2083_c0_g1_i2.p1 TRINITY_DN2083_c0_g1~~TRINITY_DN2083_c0_g1_i2.p1  ORF type:complete len:285 (-),score=41.65 TRINITY_DN2083_c0_g1_i2:78-932(-)